MSFSKEVQEDISEADMSDKKQEAITSKDDEIETLSKENEDEMCKADARVQTKKRSTRKDCVIAMSSKHLEVPCPAETNLDDQKKESVTLDDGVASLCEDDVCGTVLVPTSSLTPIEIRLPVQQEVIVPKDSPITGIDDDVCAVDDMSRKRKTNNDGIERNEQK